MLLFNSYYLTERAGSRQSSHRKPPAPIGLLFPSFLLSVSWLICVSSSSLLRTMADGSAPSFFVAFTSAFSSSRSRFSLARRFWNHVITCALDSRSARPISSRSVGVRYFWRMKRRSSWNICWLVKAVRLFRRFLDDRGQHLEKSNDVMSNRHFVDSVFMNYNRECVWIL